MGKGSRTRNERAENALLKANDRKPVKNAKRKNGMPTWVGTTIVIALAVVLVALVVVTALSSAGVFGRMRKVATSANYEITGPMMSYLISSECQSTLSMYNQYTSGSGAISIGAGEGGTALKSNESYTLDQLRKIIYSVKTDESGNTVTTTWFDHFAEIAVKDAKQILACCEAARGNLELDQEELDAIEQEISYIKMYASLYGLDTAAWLKMNYGEGVSENDIREMMKLTQLASKWSEHMSDQFYDGIKDEDVLKYYDEHKKDFDIFCDYMGYTFTSSFVPSTKENADEKATENAELAAKYKAEQERFAAYMEDLATATNKEEFTEKLKTHLLAEEKIKMADEKKKAVEDLTAEEIADCDNKANAAVLKATYNNVKDTDGSSDLDKWLFESDTEGEGEDKVETYKRKPNDVKKIESKSDVVTEGDNAYAKVSSSYSAYIYIDGMHRDNGFLHSVGHILFKSETYDGLTSSEKLTGKYKELADRLFERNKDNADYKLTAYAMAGELLDMMLEEGKITEVTEGDKKYYKVDEDAFKEYGELYTGDSNVFYDDVAAGQMVEEFENWLFDNAREQDEISYPEPVKTLYGYHIMMYRGNKVEAWKQSIKKTIQSEKQTKYLEDVQTEFPVTVDESQLRFIVA